MKTKIYLRKQLISSTKETKVEVFNFTILEPKEYVLTIDCDCIGLIEFWKSFPSKDEAINYIKTIG